MILHDSPPNFLIKRQTRHHHQHPANHDLLSVVKGARNGFVYGVKIRFPHALVMTFLFSHKPWPAKIKGILAATRTHALNLCKFVTIYKLLLILQKKLNGGKERDLDTFVAGGLGGWWVFGERTPINEQIVLYVLSRSLLSLLPRLYSTASPPKTPIEPLAHPLPPLTSPQANPKPIPPAQLPFAILSALSWASVMYMFRHRGERIQPGMANSMRYLYRDSETWRDLKTLLWHNK
ncbi:peroxisomal membrane protein 4 [Cryptococcus gattii Ru294]|uniref:Peroxisomal protein, putative n=1 Tax=Cryptococcus gattii serotype B (strain WM276 / ATCC MYA-4071) TaxID=367775 RepID=E6RAJ0_CRYGW|nr:peroxisomal protein, putative [Cryptococcus gattii WM276]ADV23845.1 peroxisomal protein, putative [Cryptococcus gattii WM276]KIR56720.1 peroxisomal membrane protein 4 [Cryptococcus gattii Ru294]KIY31745.1 peroxisomal membrane protein 4 [Cryptococcus gattii E566]KJE00491.1 peroxisomal membrane protein 4 [Cryptococcus gattii NT-10]